MNNKYTINNVVDFFLSKGAMSPKKLQKLLYYAYSWTLALMNDSAEEIRYRLFEEPIEAWVHGPVIRKVYNEYKSIGWGVIEAKLSFDETVFEEDVLDILNQVWDVYGKFTANELETMTHREDPWIDARKGIPAYESCENRLSDAVIFRFFNEQAEKSA